MIPTDWLRHRLRTDPDALAVRAERGESLSFAELVGRAEAALPELEGATGCVIELEPGIDHALATAAATLAGVPFQTLRPGLPEAEQRDALAGAEGWLRFDPGWTASPGRAGSPSALGRVAGDQTLCRVLTSGTSGAHKPIELTYANHYCSAAGSAFNLGVRPDDRWLCCMPVDHIGGLSILIRSWIYGTAAVLHPAFDRDRVAAELERAISIVSLVPTQLQRLLAIGAPLERPRLILLGGAPAPEQLLDQALEQGAKVVQTYGLTEACSQVCTLSAADARRARGAAGRPLLGTELRIDDGEILVRGPTVAPASVGPDGWLRTGDRGRLDREGMLRVEGRLDDLIVTGGENVVPEEVEAVLRSHPGVADVAVFGRPDREWGAAVSAAVVAEVGSEPSAGELIDHCRASLAAHKLPKSVEFVGDLPRSASGKLLRRRLG